METAYAIIVFACAVCVLIACVGALALCLDGGIREGDGGMLVLALIAGAFTALMGWVSILAFQLIP